MRGTVPSLTPTDESWSVQPRLRDAGAGGLAPRARHHRHPGLGGPRGALRIYPDQTGWMVSIIHDLSHANGDAPCFLLRFRSKRVVLILMTFIKDIFYY